jgi:hypothetical protein
MHRLYRWLGIALAASAVALAAGPAAADRPSCEDIVSAQSSGQTAEQIVQRFGITKARVDACARVVAQRQQQAAQRSQVQVERQQRAVARVR